MTWLLTQMWALMGGAAFLALLIGWGLRGALLKGRLRRAEVEAGVSKTELEQARTEIEGLYLAQRKLTAASAPDAGTDLTARDEQVAQLTSELASVRAELETARSEPVETIAAPVEPAPQADMSEAATNLEWHNRYLETRVRTLEEQLKAGMQAAPAEAEEAVPAVAALPVEESPGESVELAKLRWQNDYLRTRLKVFEQRMGVQLSGEPPEGPEDLDEEEDITPDLPQTAGEDARETPDEELARLRWRNRYLEGRLAYLEEERSKEEPSSVMQTAAPEPVEEAPSVTVDPAVLDPEPEPVPSVTEAEDTVDEPVSVVAAPEPEVSEPELDVSEPEVEAEAEGELQGATETVEPEPEPVEEDGNTSEPAETEREPDETGDEEPGLAADTLLEVPVEAQAPIEAPAFVEMSEEPETPVSEASADMEPAAQAEDSEPVQPVGLDKPRGGTPDDLTQIEGIGPRIQDVLNSLGVYHYDQIGEWSAGNEAWVDNYLSFSGRVSREQWVEQARGLAAAALA